MKARLFALSTLLILAFATLSAQQARFSGDQECGVVDDRDWMDRYLAGEIAPVGKTVMPTFLPLHIVIMGDDDGNGYLDLPTLFNALKLVNEDFESLNVQFFIDGDIQYENRTRYYDHEEFSDGIQMIRRYNRDNVINSYFVANPAGNCGYYASSGEGVVMANGCSDDGDHTWSHELGHFFTLRHTFSGWEGRDIDQQDWSTPAPRTVNGGREVELVDGSNCLTAADGFCDTPPDYLSDRWNCNTDGNFADTLMDPDSARFLVPGWPIMSYALDRCVDSFSMEQQTAVLTHIANRRSNLFRDYVVTDEPVGADINHISPEANATLPFYNEVNFQWSSVENADFYVVQLNRSATFPDDPDYTYITYDTTLSVNPILRERFRYYWRVKPVNRYKVCAEFSASTRFRTGTELTSTIDAAFDAALTVSPNPVGGEEALRISARGNGLAGQLTYQLTDATGRIVRSQSGLSSLDGGFTEQLSTAGLQPGVYFLRLLLDERLVTRRVVVR